MLLKNQEENIMRDSKNNNTSISLNEHLSAVMDDEAGAFEQTRVLDELSKNDTGELRQSLLSYSLIGEVMRSGGSTDNTLITDNTFLSGIHEQIEKESAYQQINIKETAKPAANNGSWLRPVGGFALAASFAAIAVIGVKNYGVKNYQQTDTSSTQLLVSTESSKTEPVKTQLSPAAMKSATVISAADMVKAEEAAEDNVVAAVAKTSKKKDTYKYADAHTRALLKRYVDSHMQFASNTTFVPSVRVISYSDL